MGHTAGPPSQKVHAGYKMSRSLGVFNYYEVKIGFRNKQYFLLNALILACLVMESFIPIIMQAKTDTLI